MVIFLNKIYLNFKELKNLERLTFGYSFNNPIDNLPQNLKTLTFGLDFNIDLPGIFSNLKKLETLKFSNKFNKPVENLPQNLKTLIFGVDFNPEQLPENFSGCELAAHVLAQSQPGQGAGAGGDRAGGLSQARPRRGPLAPGHKRSRKNSPRI